MSLLISSVLLWSLIHLFPVLAPARREALRDRLGHNQYRGLFSLLSLAALVLIVTGWRSAEWVHVYMPPSWGKSAAMLLVLLALILFASSSLPNNLKRIVRHPQLAGVKTWAVAHLLANGDQRSLVLFGGLLLWAVIEVVLISRREGPWQKPEKVPWPKDAITLLAGFVVFGVLIWAHRWFIGVPLLPV